MDETHSYTFDVFLSYSSLDAAWVRKHLIPFLEMHQIRVADHAQFRPGHPKLDELEQAIIQSRRTLLILTPAYLQDTWQQFAGTLASSYGLTVEEWRVIPAILQPCTLSIRLNALTSLDLTGDDPDSWQRLLQALKPSATYETSWQAPRAKQRHRSRRWSMIVGVVFLVLIAIALSTKQIQAKRQALQTQQAQALDSLHIVPDHTTFIQIRVNDTPMPLHLITQTADNVIYETLEPIPRGTVIRVTFFLQHQGTVPLSLRGVRAGGRGPGAKERDWSAPSVDFPSTPATLQPQQIFTYQQERSFAVEGSYFIEPLVYPTTRGWGGVKPWVRLYVTVTP